MNPVLNFLLGPVLDKIFKFIPDPQQKAQAQIELLQLQQSAEFKELDAAIALGQQQSDVNKVEAASSDKFVSRWRPLIGYICGAALGMHYLIGPFATWIASLCGHPIQFPQLDMVPLMGLLSGMMGLAGLRTYEKISGVA